MTVKVLRMIILGREIKSALCTGSYKCEITYTRITMVYLYDEMPLTHTLEQFRSMT